MLRFFLIVMIVALLGACEDRGSSSGVTSVGNGTAATQPVATFEGPTSVQSDDPREALFLGFSAPKPPTWIWHPPDGRMRAANFTVPGRDGSDAAHITVFYFGEGQGGTIEDNIDRWTLQFQGPDETRVEPAVKKIEVAGMPVTMVEFVGAWVKPGTGWFTEGQHFITAIVEAPAGNVFIRFAGDEATVGRNRDLFIELVEGLKVVEQEEGH